MSWQLIAAADLVIALLTACIGSYCVARRQGRALQDGFSDELGSSERHALQINDSVVQGLTVAKYALDQGRAEQGMRAVNETLQQARTITSDLLGENEPGSDMRAGNLRRDRPAGVEGKPL